MDLRLPDDIEQLLIDGQRLRGTHALMTRRGITLTQAEMLTGHWLFEWLRAGHSIDDSGNGTP